MGHFRAGLKNVKGRCRGRVLAQSATPPENNACARSPLVEEAKPGHVTEYHRQEDCPSALQQIERSSEEN